jgi:hypothetical protein
MRELLFTYNKTFKSYEENYDKIKKEFSKNCFMNKNTLELISTCIFSLKHGRHPIIAGNSGTGKKLLACQLGDYFNEYIAEKNLDNNIDYNIENNKINNDGKVSSNNLNTSSNASAGKKRNNKNEEQSLYIVYCTKSSKVEDLMGKPRVSNDKNEDIIQWQDGPLIKAVREGKPLILIGIHELQSSVLEFMNDILDRKYDGKQRYLNNPNNPNEPSIPIHRNFRLICTTLLSEINKLSPAFATRMDIKILNDQLEGITDNDLLSLIKTCMNNVKLELASYEDDIQKRLKYLKEELLSNIQGQNSSKISDSTKKLLSLVINEEKEIKSRKVSIDSKKSNKSNNSVLSNKSKKSKSSNLSINSKKSNKSRQSNGSKDSKSSNKSKDSKHSNVSRDSKNSRNSQRSKKSNKSEDLKKSNKSKESEESIKQKDSINLSDSDEDSPEKRRKRRRIYSFDSQQSNEENDLKEDLEDDLINEKKREDIIKEEIEYLEDRKNEKFDEKRINEIISNHEILLELKKYFEEYNKENDLKEDLEDDLINEKKKRRYY